MKKKLQIHPWLCDLPYDIIGGAFFAVGYYTFVKDAYFAPGGVGGLAIIINYFTGLPIGIMTLILNAPIILLTYRYLSKGFFLRSLKSMIIAAFFMDVVFPLFPLYSGEPFLAAIFAGITTGIGLALIYMRDSSTGGSDFAVMAIKKANPHLSIGQVTSALDGAVILLGGFVYANIDAILYGIITTIIHSIIIDKIMYGIDAGKLLLIVSDYGTEIARKIDETVYRGATLLNAVGSYSKQDKHVVLCACSNSQAAKIRKAAHVVDPQALVIITESNEVFGLGFKPADK